MKIKTIFKINIALIFLQALPLYISLFSIDFKMTLMGDFFGPSAPLPVIIMGLISVGLFYYGSKKGTV